uniref:Uncharacterized protein n=1 Tax=Anguilla anguilla TaxID=7936 RepID=A0A0E9Q1D2_ANGAN
MAAGEDQRQKQKQKP